MATRDGHISCNSTVWPLQTLASKPGTVPRGLVQGHGQLESIPACNGRDVGYAVDRSLVHQKASLQNFTFCSALFFLKIYKCIVTGQQLEVNKGQRILNAS